MIIRRAREDDFGIVSTFLKEIAEQHRRGRPDIFKEDVQKYSYEEYCELLSDDSKPVFVAESLDGNKILAHAFCRIIIQPERSVAFSRKTLFLDDLYVSPEVRGGGIGGEMIKYLKSFALEQCCYNLELNVWEFNGGAVSFYEKLGLHTQKRQMEYVLNGDS